MSVRRSLFWSYGSQFITLVVSFTTSVLVARLISPRDMGIYALALAISGVLSVLLSFGTQSFIVREAVLDRETLRSAFTVNLILSLSLAVAFFVAGIYCVRASNNRTLGLVLAILSAGPLSFVFEFVPASLFVRDMRYSFISIVTIVRTSISSAATLTALWSGAGAIGLACGPAISGATGAVIYMTARRRDLVFRLGFHRFREILVFGTQMISISGVAQVASRGSDLILGGTLGLYALGQYSRASNLSSLIFLNVYGLATSVIFVQLSRDLRDSGEIRRTFIQALRMITGVMWPVLVGIAILSGPLVLKLYGAKWLPAAVPLSLLMIAQFIVLGFGMNWELFVLRNETRRQVWIEAARASIGTAIFAVGCLFGLTFAALGRVGEAVVGYALYRPHIDRLAGTEPGEVENVYIESLQLTVAATLPSLVLMVWFSWSAYTSLSLIMVGVVLGIVAWLALLFQRQHPLAGEILAIATYIRSRR